MASVNEIFTDIANSIRKKGVDFTKMKPSEMASKIENLPSLSMKGYFDALYNVGAYFQGDKVIGRYNSITDTQLANIISYSDTSNVTDMSSMFRKCSNLTTIPLLDTSNVIDMSYMFYYCFDLTTIPLLDTSNVTNMSSMFRDCSKLTTIPLLDTSNVTNMSYMFSDCSNLTTIPLLDTSNVTNMYQMFTYCSKLTTIPLLDTSNVTNMYQMFTYCSKLTTIPLLDTSNVTNMSYMFYNCTNLTEINMVNIGCSLDISSTALQHDALVKLISNLKSGVSNKTLTMGSTKLALLSDEEKKVATDKGWTLV